MANTVNPNKITTLCGNCGGCPTIDENDINASKITDDHGNMIQLNDEECRLLCEHLMKRFSFKMTV